MTTTYKPKGLLPDQSITGVADRVNQITAQNSPSMKRAETYGLQTMGRRGLQSSTMATQAAQAAMIDRALPMAQQDASDENQRFMQGRDITSREGMLDREIGSREKMHGMDHTQRGDQFDRSYNQADRHFDRSSGLEERRIDESGRQFDQGYGLDRDRLTENQRQFGMSHEHSQNALRQQGDLAIMNDQTQRDLTAQQIEAGERQTIAQGQVSALQNQVSSLIQLAQNTDLPAAQREQIIQSIRESTSAVVSMYNSWGQDVPLEWPTSPAAGAETPAQGSGQPAQPAQPIQISSGDWLRNRELSPNNPYRATGGGRVGAQQAQSKASQQAMEWEAQNGKLKDKYSVNYAR